MAKSYIHVNQHNIKHNRAHDDDLPVLTVKSGKRNRYGHEVTMEGSIRVVYRPDKPLSCGARVWIECDGAVKIIRRNGKSGKVRPSAKRSPPARSASAANRGGRR